MLLSVWGWSFVRKAHTGGVASLWEEPAHPDAPLPLFISADQRDEIQND